MSIQHRKFSSSGNHSTAFFLSFVRTSAWTKTIGVLGAAALISTNVALAETKKEEPAAKTSSDDQVEVVVTASRGVAQDILAVPQAMTVIDRKDLDAGEFSDIDDILHREVGIGFAPAEGNPNYWQEGFSLRGLGAQRVLTLSDGIRQAGQGIGYGGGNLSLYDTYGIDRIEVLRGPASVLYGTDAFGGVINIITREPEKRTEFGHNSGARYNFDGARDAHRFGGYLDVGDEKVGAVFSGGYLDSDTPNLPDDHEANSGSFENFGFSGKVDFHVSDETTVRLIGNIDRNNEVLITDTQIPLPIAIFGAPGSFDLVSSPLFFKFPQYRRSVLGAEVISNNVSDSVEYLKSGIYWQQLARQFHRETAFYPTFSPGFSGPPTFVDSSASIVQSIVDTDDKADTVEWQTVARIASGEHKFTTGLDVGYDVSNLPETERLTTVALAGLGAISGPTTITDRNRADAQQVRVGIFVQDNWKTSDKFELVPGLRLDYYGVEDDVSDYSDDEFGVSGSLGSVYRPTQEQSVYMTLASGFRAPDLGERFQNGIVNLGVPSRLIGKADLDAERAYSVEVGTKTQAKDFTFNLAVYSNFIEDYIGRTSVGVVDGFDTEQFTNRGQVALYGTEAQGNYKVSSSWDIFANAARTWTNHTEKVDVADWTFNYGTSYTLPVDVGPVTKVVGTLAARSVLRSTDNTDFGGQDPFTGGSFTTVDFMVSADMYESEYGRVKLISGLRNIGDRAYREPFFQLYQPGRNAYVGVQLDF